MYLNILALKFLKGFRNPFIFVCLCLCVYVCVFMFVFYVSVFMLVFNVSVFIYVGMFERIGIGIGCQSINN